MRILFLLFTSMMSGCVALNVPNVKDAVEINKGEGVMLTRFTTNCPGYRVTIINKENISIASAIFELKDSDEVKVITLPKGEYSWRGIYVDNFTSEFRNEFNFKIEENQINYVGDVLIEMDWVDKTYSLDFKNNLNTVEKFKYIYPMLTGNHPINESITSKPQKATSKREFSESPTPLFFPTPQDTRNCF